MSDADIEGAAPGVKDLRPDFDFGGTLAATFGTFFKRPFYFVSVTFACLLVMGLISGGAMALIIVPAMLGIGEPALDPNETFEFLGQMLLGYALFLTLVGLGAAFMAGLVTRSAVSVRLHNEVQFGSALKRGLIGTVPLFLITAAVAVLVSIGWVMLVIPGLVILLAYAALFGMVGPVIAYEGKGFSAIPRSLELTKNYRWVLLGFTVVIYIITYFGALIVALISSLVLLPLTMAVESGSNGWLVVLFPILTFLLTASVYGAVISFPYIASAMAYVRLREIKDMDGEDLLKVFA